ncbi:MAG: glycosyltransferase family 4 protein [Candidatus Bathyarchaeota archaeon]|nr:glycosyltransferase family 4 protein [Candidatus Bathyarchaeota archaeon]
MPQSKLCVVTHTFLPHVGGIEKVVYEQGKRLIQKDYNVKVVTSKLYKKRNYSIGGINVQTYNSFNIGFRLGIPYPIPNFSSYKTFKETIKSSDLIHAHGHPYLSSLVAARLAKKYSKPLVVTQHNTFIQYNALWNAFERLNDLTVGKEILKLADRIIVVSSATRKYVLSLGADSKKIVVLHNGVDIQRFRPEDVIKEEMRRKLGIHKDAKVALSVRRLVYKNGIDTLIKSAEMVVQKNSNLVFLVIGKGPDLSEVKERIRQLKLEKNIKLLGFISDEELPFYYNTADFFILPSKSGEGLPLVSLEAMACGLPVIATKVGGIEEIMEENFGIIVPPDNPDSLKGAILDFSQRDLSIVKKDLRLSMELKHSWDENVQKLTKIYEELI